MLAGIACGSTGSGASGGSITRRRPPVTASRGGSLLHPFRYERFASGDLHPSRTALIPWS